MMKTYSEPANVWGQLTDRRSYGESDAVAALLDEVDDVPVVEGVDLHMVDGEDPVADLEPAAPLCRGAWTEEMW